MVREALELKLEKCLRAQPGMIEEGLWLLDGKPTLSARAIESWLGGKEQEHAWDKNYSHGPRIPDFMGINRDGQFVIGDFKVGGGSIDAGPWQLLEYYLVLQEDDEAKARLREKEAKLTTFSFRDTQLYLVVCGHFSRLARKRLEMSEVYCQRKCGRDVVFKMFEAISPDGTLSTITEVRPLQMV